MQTLVRKGQHFTISSIASKSSSSISGSSSSSTSQSPESADSASSLSSSPSLESADSASSSSSPEFAESISTSPLPATSCQSTEQSPSYFVKPAKPKISEEIFLQIEQNEWIADEVIDAIQQLVLVQCGAKAQPTVHSAVHFQAERYQVIQIHNSGGQHWFTSTSIYNKIEVFDSIRRNDLSPEGKRQILEKYECFKDASGLLHVEIPRVSQQINGYDCGAYASAFAVDLALGNNPSRVVYEPTEIRRHLITILRSGSLTAFPSKKRVGAPAAPIYLTMDCLTRPRFANADLILEDCPVKRGRPSHAGDRQWAIKRTAGKKAAASAKKK